MQELMQRLRSRGPARRTRRCAFARQALIFLPAAALLLYSVHSALRLASRPLAALSGSGAPAGAACVAWRHTLACSPFGARVPSGDRSCDTLITKDAGFCECAGGLTTHRTTCGYHKPYTCAAACAALRLDDSEALRYPAPLRCEGQEPYLAEKWILHDNDSWAAAAAEVSTQSGARAPAARLQRKQQRRDAAAAVLWGQVQEAMLAAGPHAVDPPGVRTNKNDFVRAGLRMSRKDVARARDQWRAFLAAAPSYPAGQPGGRGIVILSGGLPYMVPAWVNVHMLRLAGCKLPVEMFFPEGEAPSPGLQAALARLGVTVRALPPAVSRLAGFAMKAATLLLSGFQEVMFLDADNVAVRDPAPLFESPEYRAAGALLWPDYWASSAAPDAEAVLEIDFRAMPQGTFESGQMLFDKRRHWQGVLLAAFFNTQAQLYYELLSNFMGKGDKETFAYALLATNGSYALVSSPVGAIGVNKMHCNKRQTNCWHEFAGNTMTQHDEHGELLFLHANFKPKMDLALPHEWDAYTRRWQLQVPGWTQFPAAIVASQQRDLEHEAFQMLAHFRCVAWLPEYLAALGAKAPAALSGFHPVHNGMDFRRPYRWGMLGDYLSFTEVSFGDKWKHFKNTRLRRLFRRG